MTEPTSPSVSGEMRERIAISLWSRFAPVHHIGWKDETHRAEYYAAADAILALTRPAPSSPDATTISNRLSDSPALDPVTVERLQEFVRDCDLRGGSWKQLGYDIRALIGQPSPKSIHFEFTDEERAAIKELSDFHQISEMQTLRQALRTYQLQERRIRDGETVAWSGDAQRAADFSGQPAPSSTVGEREACDRTETIIERSLNCRWITVLDREQFKATLRIALDTEVRAGGPYLDNVCNAALSLRSVKAPVARHLTRYRPHKHSLADSMSEVSEIEPTRAALLEFIRKDLEPWRGWLDANDDWGKTPLSERLHVTPYYGDDDRIGWKDVHIVTLDGYGVLGFCEGNPV